MKRMAAIDRIKVILEEEWGGRSDSPADINLIGADCIVVTRKNLDMGDDLGKIFNAGFRVGLEVQNVTSRHGHNKVVLIVTE